MVKVRIPQATNVVNHLGPICGKSHEFEKTGKSLRTPSGKCIECGKINDKKKKKKGRKKGACGVSRLERWLQVVLKIFYPDTEFHFNRWDRIGLELDIYLPDFSLAFEINGPCHYVPIYGEEKLIRKQKRDKLRIQKCKRLGIHLVSIDVSKEPSFTPDGSIWVLDLIKKEIDTRI